MFFKKSISNEQKNLLIETNDRIRKYFRNLEIDCYDMASCKSLKQFLGELSNMTKDEFVENCLVKVTISSELIYLLLHKKEVAIKVLLEPNTIKNDNEMKFCLSVVKKMTEIQLSKSIKRLDDRIELCQQALKNTAKVPLTL